MHLPPACCFRRCRRRSRCRCCCCSPRAERPTLALTPLTRICAPPPLLLPLSPALPDPADVKPEGWDDIPATIKDPEAKKPEDWNDEEDGEWEAPSVPNPDYKGEWKPKMIDNPEYKGKWVAPDIANPDYFTDDKLYAFTDLKYVGFELWQVKAGSIFDNIIVTDSLDAAKKFGEETWGKTSEGEKKMFEEHKKQVSYRIECEEEGRGRRKGLAASARIVLLGDTWLLRDGAPDGVRVLRDPMDRQHAADAVLSTLPRPGSFSLPPPRSDTSPPNIST